MYKTKKQILQHKPGQHDVCSIKVWANELYNASPVATVHKRHLCPPFSLKFISSQVNNFSIKLFTLMTSLRASQLQKRVCL
jgi:hypothetical protein